MKRHSFFGAGRQQDKTPAADRVILAMQDDTIARQRELIEDLLADQKAATDDLVAIAQRLKSLEVSARHLINVLGAESGSGPIFALNEAEDDRNLDVIRHAVVALQAVVSGTEPPPLTLQPRSIH